MYANLSVQRYSPTVLEFSSTIPSRRMILKRRPSLICSHSTSFLAMCVVVPPSRTGGYSNVDVDNKSTCLSDGHAYLVHLSERPRAHHSLVARSEPDEPGGPFGTRMIFRPQYMRAGQIWHADNDDDACWSLLRTVQS